MKLYKCKFPGCNFETTNRNHIDFHHIVPKGLGGSNKKFNLISLCPNHHRQIYVEGAACGIHSIKTKVSIKILQLYETSVGASMHYFDYQDDTEKLLIFNTGEITNW